MDLKQDNSRLGRNQLPKIDTVIVFIAAKDIRAATRPISPHITALRPFWRCSLFPLDIIMLYPPLITKKIDKTTATIKSISTATLIRSLAFSIPPLGASTAYAFSIPGKDNVRYFINSELLWITKPVNTKNIRSDYLQYNKRKYNKQKADNG